MQEGGIRKCSEKLILYKSRVNKISLQKNLAIVASSFGAFSNSPFLHSRVKKISLKKTK
jgi:hypothetical protein